MNKLKEGILYLSLHNRIVDMFGTNQKVSRKELFGRINRHFLFPKNLRPVLLKEMEEKNLIKILDRDHVEIISCNIDVEKDTNKIYKLAGIY